MSYKKGGTPQNFKIEITCTKKKLIYFFYNKIYNTEKATQNREKHTTTNFYILI